MSTNESDQKLVSFRLSDDVRYKCQTIVSKIGETPTSFCKNILSHMATCDDLILPILLPYPAFTNSIIREIFGEVNFGKENILLVPFLLANSVKIMEFLVKTQPGISDYVNSVKTMNNLLERIS